ncbi:uncharacterized protein LOC130273445 [Hyla sarda]|uniref:uncharacterized protein LOC130273445 n=1 Tax=Hyla sarda TaxID=327740 RepID=UPI0024C3CAB2|nr:uncharacterized protein LOC130273445 [Hyla sarda]
MLLQPPFTSYGRGLHLTKRGRLISTEHCYPAGLSSPSLRSLTPALNSAQTQQQTPLDGGQQILHGAQLNRTLCSSHQLQTCSMPASDLLRHTTAKAAGTIIYSAAVLASQRAAVLTAPAPTRCSSLPELDNSAPRTNRLHSRLPGGERSRTTDKQSAVLTSPAPSLPQVSSTIPGKNCNTTCLLYFTLPTRTSPHNKKEPSSGYNYMNISALA